MRLFQDRLEASRLRALFTILQVLSFKDPDSLSVTFPYPQIDSHLEIWQEIKTFDYGYSLQTFELPFFLFYFFLLPTVMVILIVN